MGEKQKKDREKQEGEKRRAGGSWQVSVAFLVLLAVFMLSALAAFRFREKDILRIGIFYGSNWEVPGTEQYDIFDKAIKKYQKVYPQIRVEYEEGITPKDYSEWLSGEILKGEEPDVFLILDKDFNSLVSANALKSLDKIIAADAEADLSEFYDSACRSGQYKGQQYALPFECNPALMFVNKSLLKKEKIPMPEDDWTWDDFYRICKKVVKDTNGDGQIDQFGCCDYTWKQAVYANGICPFDEDGETVFTDSRFMEAVNFVKQLTNLNQNYQVTANDFDLGHVAFRPLTFSEYRTYMPYPWRIKKYSDFEWNCIQMPAGPSGENISGMDTLMAGISARTTKEKEAWEFLKMLTMDEEIQKLIYEDTSGASALKSVSTSEDVMTLLNRDTPGGSDIDLSLLDQTIENAVILPHFKNDKEALEKADDLLTGLLLSDDDISTSMFQLKKEVDAIIRR